MSSNTPRLTAVAILGAALALPAGAQTVRADFQNDVFPTAGYTGTTDVTITVQDEASDGDENANYHSRQALAADGFPVRQSALIRFSVDGGQVPATTNITGANLEFFITNESWSGFSIYEVLRPWDQGQATYGKPMDNQTWAVPGAAGVGVDRSATPISTFGHIDAGAYALIGMTDAGVDLVRKWIAGTATNNGLIVQDYDSWDKMVWDSSEGASPPHLIVYFSGTSEKLPVTGDTMIAYQPEISWDTWGLGFSGRPNLLTSSLIRWDVRAIPPGARVTSAGMLFTVNKLPAAADAGPFDVYPALRPWNERADWLMYDGNNFWSQAGARSAGLDIGPKIGPFPPTCTVPESLCPVAPAGLVGVVQKWVDDPSNYNFGLSLQNYNNNDDLVLIDSEWRVAGRRPKLSVQFIWDASGPPGLYPAYAEVYPSERVAMKALGGVGDYEFSVSGLSGATIDDGGIYTAGLFGGQDQVRVADQGGAGASAFATIVVLGNSSTVDGGSPIVISFPTPSPPVPPQGNFAVIAHISSRTVSPVSGLRLELSGEALSPEAASLVGGGRLTDLPDAGFLLPLLDTGATLQVSITGSMHAVPRDSPSVTATVRSGPAVVARATTPVPLDVPPSISTGCSCGPTTGGMGVVLLAGIVQMVARRRSTVLKG